MKTTKYSVFTMLVLAGGLSLASCSSDDDGEMGSPKQKVSVIINNEGNMLLPTYMWGYQFAYNKNGTLSGFIYYDDEYTVSYNPCIITSDDRDEIINVGFNGKGYISSLSYKCEYGDESGYENDQASMDFSYNNSGQLTKISINSSCTGKEGGIKYKETSKGNLNLTWKNGNLHSASISETGVDEDDERWKYTCDYEYSYSDAEQNTCKQFTKLQAYAIDEFDFLEPLAFVGMLGVASAELPTSVNVEKMETGDDESYVEKDRATYAFNSDGTIKYERLDGYNGKYTYMSLSELAANVRGGELFENNEKSKTRRLGRIMHRRHHRR